MPTDDTEPQNTPLDDTQPEESGGSAKKLGFGAWLCVVWLVAVFLVSIISPLFQAEGIGGVDRSAICGDGSGLPIYNPVDCKDLKALGAHRTGIGEGEFTHVLGVDSGGADVLSKLLVGGRTTLAMALVAIAVSTLLGTTLGLVSGYFKGRIDQIITGIFDVLIGFPALVLALLIVTVVAANDSDRRVPGIVLAMIIVMTPIIGRISRAATLAWAGREFVIAAQSLGAKAPRVIFREVLPNVFPAVLSIAMLGVGILVVAEASLAIIGVGVPADTVSWGSMVAEGGSNFRDFSHLVFIPSIAIVITVSALNFLGDALRRKFDVKESAL